MNAAHNKLIYVPSEVGKLKDITEIDLNSNNLLGLPSAMFESHAIFSLRSLDVSNNQIAELPHSLANVKGLQSLKLSNNQLKFLPASLKELTKLGTLDYGGNDWYAFRSGMHVSDRSYGVKALMMVETLSL